MAVHIFETKLALVEAAAAEIARCSDEATDNDRDFHILLSGGSTPEPVYSRLSQPPYRENIVWDRWHVFWGDERAVPPEHSDSNYRMAHDALLSLVPIPASRIHRIPAELEPDAAADDYEKLLRDLFGDKLQFNLALQGMGSDGHTASLFPGTPAIQESKRWVMAQHVSGVDAWRITLTAPAINSSKEVLFLVNGEDKAPALAQVLQGPPDAQQYPAQLIQPVGDLHWYVDRSAASQLVE